MGDRTFGGASDIQLCVPYLDYKYLLYQLLVVLYSIESESERERESERKKNGVNTHTHT